MICRGPSVTNAVPLVAFPVGFDCIICRGPSVTNAVPLVAFPVGFDVITLVELSIPVSAITSTMQLFATKDIIKLAKITHAVVNTKRNIFVDLNKTVDFKPPYIVFHLIPYGITVNVAPPPLCMLRWQHSDTRNGRA